MKIGVDTCISLKHIKIIQERGYSVVTKAEKGEPDWLWFMRGISNGMEVVFSPDHDLEVLCKQWPYFNYPPVKIVRLKQEFFKLTEIQRIDMILNTLRKMKENNYVERTERKNETVYLPSGDCFEDSG